MCSICQALLTMHILKIMSGYDAFFINITDNASYITNFALLLAKSKSSAAFLLTAPEGQWVDLRVLRLVQLVR